MPMLDAGFLSSPWAALGMGLLAAGGPHQFGQNRAQTGLNAFAVMQQLATQQQLAQQKLEAQKVQSALAARQLSAQEGLLSGLAAKRPARKAEATWDYQSDMPAVLPALPESPAVPPHVQALIRAGVAGDIPKEVFETIGRAYGLAVDAPTEGTSLQRVNLLLPGASIPVGGYFDPAEGMLYTLDGTPQPAARLYGTGSTPAESAYGGMAGTTAFAQDIGVEPAAAAKQALGMYRTLPSPYGPSVVAEMSSGQPQRLGVGGPGGQITPIPSAGLPAGGVPGEEAFGPSGVFGLWANTITEFVGLGQAAPETEQAARAAERFNNEYTRVILATSPEPENLRATEGFRQEVRDLTPDPGSVRAGDERALIKYKEMRERAYSTVRQNNAIIKRYAELGYQGPELAQREAANLMLAEEVIPALDQIIAGWRRAPSGPGVQEIEPGAMGDRVIHLPGGGTLEPID